MGLVVEAELGSAMGRAAGARRTTSPGSRRPRSTPKSYDVREFVDDLRELNGHAAYCLETSSLVYTIRQRDYKRAEEPFGWAETIGSRARPFCVEPHCRDSSYLTMAVLRPDRCAGRQHRTRHLAGSGPAARLGGSFFVLRAEAIKISPES